MDKLLRRQLENEVHLQSVMPSALGRSAKVVISITPVGSGSGSQNAVGFGIESACFDAFSACRMFNRAIAGPSLPRHVSSDHDPLCRFRCLDGVKQDGRSH